MTVAREWKWALLVSLGIVFLASIPYLFGYAIAPPVHKFVGLTYNVDDALVYLSWMRQAADGHFFARNLFTTEPQIGHNFNLLFFALGRFAGLTHLPLIAVFHLARIVFGVGLLLLIYAFARLWIPDLRTRRLVLLVAGLSSGLGWLVPIGQGFDRSVDLWQPEAITFLSIYLSPLFSFSMILMVGSLYLLYLHSLTGRARHAVLAGALLLILGNVHTYDLIPVGITWALYASVSLLRRNTRPMLGGLIAGGIAVSSAAYQAYTYLHEPVFRIRADVLTLSPSIVFYLLGLGLLIPLAALGLRRFRSERADYALLACWMLAALGAAYLPVSFQRKLLMGIHIPISILAGVGLAVAASRMKGRASSALTVLLVILLIPSNVVFMTRDMARTTASEAHTTAHSPFISSDEIAVLEYLRLHSGANDVVLAQPSFASLVPAWTGRPVYCGHWGETVRFGEKLREVLRYYRDTDDAEQRATFLRQRGIEYVVEDEGAAAQPSWIPVYRSGSVVLYHVR